MISAGSAAAFEDVFFAGAGLNGLGSAALAAGSALGAAGLKGLGVSEATGAPIGLNGLFSADFGVLLSEFAAALKGLLSSGILAGSAAALDLVLLVLGASASIFLDLAGLNGLEPSDAIGEDA